MITTKPFLPNAYPETFEVVDASYL